MKYILDELTEKIDLTIQLRYCFYKTAQLLNQTAVSEKNNFFFELSFK